jgi:FkbM family methyltransferase
VQPTKQPPVLVTSEADPDIGLVAARHGHFFVNRHDSYVGMSLLMYGEYCETEWQMIDRFISSGDTVMDIGANIGAFSIPMAKKTGPSGKVICFEPQPYAYALLEANIGMNKLRHVQAFPYGLSASEEKREAALPEYNQQGNFGGVCFVNNGHGLGAPFAPLDTVFHSSRLDFIKMDVEGMEADVLKGANGTIKRFRPVMYMENHPGERSPPLISALLALDYRLWWHTPYFYTPDNFFGQKENVYDRQANVNMVCLPVERLDLLQRIPAGLRLVSGPEDKLRENDAMLASLPLPE